MAAAEADPFLQVQAEVITQLTSARALYTSFLRIRTHSPTPTSPELISARQDLEDTLEALAEDLADLLESVKAVQGDPYKYGLEIEEVARRKRMVDDVGREIADIRGEVMKGGQDKGKGRAMDSDDDDEREGGDSYREFEQQQQVQIMHEQDEVMDGVFTTVGNLRQQASDMGRELEEQTEILNDVDGLADRVGGRLQTGMKQMGVVMRQNEDTMSSCCIGLLIFVLILLLVLVLVL